MVKLVTYFIIMLRVVSGQGCASDFVMLVRIGDYKRNDRCRPVLLQDVDAPVFEMLSVVTSSFTLAEMSRYAGGDAVEMLQLLSSKILPVPLTY